MPSFILIRPTVWPQYTNVTDRQMDRQTDLWYWSVVCPVLSVSLVYCPYGWIGMPLAMEVGLGAGHIVLCGHPALLSPKGAQLLTFQIYRKPVSV